MATFCGFSLHYSSLPYERGAGDSLVAAAQLHGINSFGLVGKTDIVVGGTGGNGAADKQCAVNRIDSQRGRTGKRPAGRCPTSRTARRMVDNH